MEMIKTVGELLLVLLILFGALLSAISAYGLIRLPDIYLRLHASAKSASLGVLCVLSGVFLYFAFFLDHVSTKLLVGILFVFVTAPLSSHLTSRAAYRSGVPLWKHSGQDELEKVLRERKDSDRNG